MDDTVTLETKRSRAREVVARPADPAPAKSASFDERLDWSIRFVRWAFAEKALSAPHPDSGVHGHLWRVELSSCVLDPQEYERNIERLGSEEEAT